MDKIQKALKKLHPKEKLAVKKILQQLANGKIQALDVKKLKNRDDIYRVRKGQVRIIYRITDNKIYILSIERRSDTTYSL